MRPVGERLFGNGVGHGVSVGRRPGQRERVEPHRFRIVPSTEGRIALSLQLPSVHLALHVLMPFFPCMFLFYFFFQASWHMQE
jgi:hypothetical protein